MPSELEIAVAEPGGDGVLVAWIQGDAGVANTDKLEREFTRIVARHPKLLVLDLSAMSFISSLGMSYLVHLNRGVKSHGGDVRVTGATPLILTALKRCKLDELFTFYDTADAALQV
jgi:anti-sigma B factor antagonist